MRKNATAKALVMSVLALMLCLSMLVGTTFAWFTDSVTSGVNKIVAGNLDVELEYAKASVGTAPAEADWKTVQDVTGLFMPTEGEGSTLWEPGHTEYVYLRIRNAGTLALKYQFAVNVYGDEAGGAEKEYTNKDDGTFRLSDYLVFNQIDGAAAVSSREELWLAADKEEDAMGDLSGLGMAGVLNPGEMKPLTLAVYMPTSVGNAANYKTGTDAPTIFLGLNLTATQTPKEFDSFDDQYDKDLPLTQITSAEELKSLIENGGSAMLMDDMDAGSESGSKFTITNDTVIDGNGKTLTTKDPETSTQSRVFDMDGLTESTTLTIQNANVTGGTEARAAPYLYRGISLYGNVDPVLNVNNSTVKAGHYAINVAGANQNPKINVKDSTIEGYCGFQTYSANTTATFDNSTISGVNQWGDGYWNSFSAVVVNDSATDSVLTFNNCSFKAEDVDVNAPETFFSLRTGCTVYLNNCTFTKNGETISTEDIIKDIEGNTCKYILHYNRDDVSIYVDGTKVK